MTSEPQRRHALTWLNGKVKINDDCLDVADSKKTVNENVGFAWTIKKDNENVPKCLDVFVLEKKELAMSHEKKVLQAFLELQILLM